MTTTVPSPAPTLRPRSLVPVAAVALATLAAAPAASAAGEPTVVDDGAAVLAISGDGASAAWLHAEYANGSSRPTSMSLRVRAGDGTVTEIDRKLPRNTSDLAYGTDAKGVPTVVLAAGGTATSGTTTLYALPADGSRAPRKLAASKPAGAESAPGLLKGVLSFSRFERTRRGGKKHDTVRLGSLTSSSSRLVSKGEVGSSVTQTTPTIRRGVAYVMERPNGAGANYQLRMAQAGKRSTLLSRTGFGGASEAGFGNVLTIQDGAGVVATRWVDDNGGHPADRTIYAAPSGKRVGAVSKLQPNEQDLGVPVKGGILYVDYDANDDNEPGDEQLQFRPTS